VVVVLAEEGKVPDAFLSKPLVPGEDVRAGGYLRRHDRGAEHRPTVGCVTPD
jgi:hypothetical protein